MFWHEQTLHVKLVWAMRPAHLAVLPAPTVGEGPPPVQVAGGGKTRAATQPPPTHPWFAPQTCPQLPQLLLSLPVSTHWPAHAVWPAPGRHEPEQPPPMQTCPAAHLFPQLPQLFGSFATGMHVPPHIAW